ncbi:MAG: PBP1A family penicillin-binding protein [Chloroflexota bacterium]|nr:MAG: PBP1A family penicillin-binding protein [Chloroflexota bacterium]
MQTAASSRRDRSAAVDGTDPEDRKRGSPGGWGLFLLTGAVTFVVGLFLLAVFGVTLAILGARSLDGVGGIIDALSRDLPAPEAAVERDVFKSTFIYDRNGEPLYEIFDPNGGRRVIIPISDMPQHLVAATLATEDANFYENPGFDLRAIARALWQNFRGQGYSGASTITQQLVRNALFDPEQRTERSLDRKMKEAILAYKLSQKYSKDEILERYLNEISYGNLAYGIESAARTYFDKSARDLNLAEATLLAGLPQSPSAYNPFINFRGAKERQAEVLGLMVRQGYITEAGAEAALKQELRFAALRSDIKAPHFVMYVRDMLEQRFGKARLYQAGFRVYTTLDLSVQRAAEEAARDHIARIRDHDARNAAVMAINPNSGEIIAMVGSVDFFDQSIAGQVNMTTALRQPGSTVKPFTYAAAFARGTMSPGTIIRDEPTQFRGAGGEPYVPRNPDGRFRGPVTVRYALANSLNIPALKVVSDIGTQTMIDLARRMGITTLGDAQRYGLTVTLGSGEVRLIDLVYAYTPFANGGLQIGQPVTNPRPGNREFEPAAILKIVDADGRVLEEYSPRPGKRVITPQVAWLISDILSDDDARTDTYGRNSPLSIGRPAAVKTGTTDRSQDSWTVGFTPDLVVGVWVGNADNTPMRQVLGVSGAGAIWNMTMTRALKNNAPRTFARPPGLVQVAIDPRTGLRPAANGPVKLEWFLEGNVPTQWTQTERTSPTRESDREIAKEPTSTPTVASTPAVAPTPFARPATPMPKPTAAPTEIAGIVTVPNVVSVAEAQARQAVEAAGLRNTYTNYQGAADVADRAFFGRTATGHVLSQTPAPGARVQRGTVIYLAVKRD